MCVSLKRKNESRQICLYNQIQGTQQSTSSETPNRMFKLEMERIAKGPEYASPEAARQKSDKQSAMEFLGHVPNFPHAALQDGALTYMPLQNMQVKDTHSCSSPYQHLYSANTVKSAARAQGSNPSIHTHSSKVHGLVSGRTRCLTVVWRSICEIEARGCEGFAEVHPLAVARYEIRLEMHLIRRAISRQKP